MNKKLMLFLVFTILLLSSCGQEEPTPTPPLPTITPLVDAPVIDTDSGTTIQWVQGEEEEGLYLDSGNDVDTEVVTVGSPPVEARRLGNCTPLPSSDGNETNDCAMQFRIDDSVIFEGSPTTKVRIEVEYFDQGTDSFFIAYYALDGEPYGDINVNKVNFSKTDTGVFKTATFTLEDVFFGNRVYGGDFRIDGMADGAEIIRSVKVTLIVDETETVDTREIAETADIIFYNGYVLSIDEHNNVFEALAVKGDKILAVGDDSEILALVGDETQVIDLEGHTLMPGFVDTHTHILDSRSNPDTENLEKAQTLALQNGITTLGDLYSSPRLLEEIRAFDDSGKLRVRTSLYLVYANPCGDVLGDWYQLHPPTREPGEMLRIGGVKVFADGGSCAYPAISFDRPEGGQGNLWFTQDQLNTIVANVDSAGYQIAIHAIGDRGVEGALNAIEFALDGQPNTLRHRIEHNTTVRPDQWPRYQEIGVVPTIIGNIWSCEPWYAGPDPLENQAWNFPYRAMLDANPDAHFVWHTDYPWSSPNPLLHLFSLVTPYEIAGDLSECADPSWVGNKTLTLDEALPMMTIESAYALFRDEEVGSLLPGKYADLIILSGNPTTDLNAIKDLKVWMTMVGGKVEYCMEGHEDVCP